MSEQIFIVSLIELKHSEKSVFYFCEHQSGMYWHVAFSVLVVPVVCYLSVLRMPWTLSMLIHVALITCKILSIPVV